MAAAENIRYCTCWTGRRQPWDAGCCANGSIARCRLLRAFRHGKRPYRHCFKTWPVEKTLEQLLSTVYDMERLCSRIVYGSVNGRDCVALARSLAKIPEIQRQLQPFDERALSIIREALDPMEHIATLLTAAILRRAAGRRQRWRHHSGRIPCRGRRASSHSTR